MALTIDERTVRPKTCERCGRSYDHINGLVHEDGDAHSIYFAACHGHPEHDAWIDVVLGTWGDNDVQDHVTFSCELRSEGAAAVDATVAVEGASDLFGRKLTRDEALGHPLVETFWQVVDLIAVQDPAVAARIYRRIN
jgi:hypothetical protein